MDQKIVPFRSNLDIRKAAVDAGVAVACPVRDVVQGVSRKWVSLLVIALAERPHRFGELRRLLSDISQRMLTQTLHDLRATVMCIAKCCRPIRPASNTA